MDRNQQRGTAAAPRHTTMLEMVMQLADGARTPNQIVAESASLLGSGEVVLTGNFRGRELELSSALATATQLGA